MTEYSKVLGMLKFQLNANSRFSQSTFGAVNKMFLELAEGKEYPSPEDAKLLGKMIEELKLNYHGECLDMRYSKKSSLEQSERIEKNHEKKLEHLEALYVSLAKCGLNPKGVKSLPTRGPVQKVKRMLGKRWNETSDTSSTKGKMHLAYSESLRVKRQESAYSQGENFGIRLTRENAGRGLHFSGIPSILNECLHDTKSGIDKELEDNFATGYVSSFRV